MNIRNNNINEDKKPLDPETEKLHRKLKRFGAIFMGLNFLALIAVFGAIVYRLGYFDDKPVVPNSTNAETADFADHDLAIPAGAKLIGSHFSDGKLTIGLRLQDGEEQIWLYDPIAKTVTGKLTLKPAD